MLRSMACWTIEELYQSLADAETRLRELAPYSGTAPGAKAIADLHRHIELVKRHIARLEGRPVRLKTPLA